MSRGFSTRRERSGKRGEKEKKKEEKKEIKKRKGLSKEKKIYSYIYKYIYSYIKEKKRRKLNTKKRKRGEIKAHKGLLWGWLRSPQPHAVATPNAPSDVEYSLWGFPLV